MPLASAQENRNASSTGTARLVAALSSGVLVASMLAFSGCGGRAQDGLADADREQLENAASLALERLEVDAEKRHDVLRGLQDQLLLSGEEHVARNVQALDHEMGELSEEELSELASAAGGTNARIGTSGGGNISLGPRANTQTQLGTSGATSGTSFGTSVGGTSARPGTASARFASIACDSFGELEAVDESANTVAFRLSCVSAASRPVIAWPSLEGPGPYQVVTVAIDVQTAANIQTTSEAALEAALESWIWTTRVSGRSVEYAGPPLSAAGGAGVLVAVVEAADGSVAVFMAVVL